MHFLHVGKTGGTAIKYALKGHQGTEHYLIYLHYHRFRLSDVPEGEGAIFFLRDPVSRFVSGFMSRQRQGRPAHYTPWSADERRAFEYFHTPDQLAVALSSYDASERIRARHAMRNIKHVNSLYRNWLESEEYLSLRLTDIFFVGFQETLLEDFAILKLKLGLPETVNLPDDDALAHKNPQDRACTLQGEALENLTHWYQQDYRFIEQCRRLRENARRISS